MVANGSLKQLVAYYMDWSGGFVVEMVVGLCVHSVRNYVPDVRISNLLVICLLVIVLEVWMGSGLCLVHMA